MLDYLGSQFRRNIVSLLRFLCFLIQKLSTLASWLEIRRFVVTDSIHLGHLETSGLSISLKLMCALNSGLCRLHLVGSGHGVLESGLGGPSIVDAASLLLVLRRVGEFLDDRSRGISGTSDSLLRVVKLSWHIVVHLNSIDFFDNGIVLFNLNHTWTVNCAPRSLTCRIWI